MIFDFGWKQQHGLSDQDVEEMITAWKEEYIAGDLSEDDFRRRLAKTGLNASSIEEIVGGL